jgi:sugar phosphate isomerase/epimerase
MFKATRRAFLSVPGAARLWAAAQRESRIGLGFRLYGMQSLRPAEALRTIARLGYDDAELELRPGWQTEPKLLSAAARRDLKAAIRDSGLAIPALGENLALDAEEAEHADNLDHIRRAAELSHYLFPNHPPMIATTTGGKITDWERREGVMTEKLAAWARTAAECGITMAIKAHADGAMDRPQRCLRLLDAVRSPRIRLTFDYSHFQVIGLDLKDSLAALLPHTALIHVKDVAVDGARYRFLLPGEGNIDYLDYFRMLAAGGYRGSVMVEVSTHVFKQPGYDPAAAARKCYAVLAPALERAGARARPPAPEA